MQILTEIPTTFDIGAFQQSLIDWYLKNQRSLPWRKTKDPYKIWISEIMLQQTQVATVIGYYQRFLERFPNIQTLAIANEEDVFAFWAGLGYYSRAKNLHRAAQIIVQNHNGVFPDDPKNIHTLPGIGPYTCGAISSIAFNQALALVDGNVIRVYSRIFGLKVPANESSHQKTIWTLARKLFFEEKPGDFNQALMELGATVCTPKKPSCDSCPVQTFCLANQTDPEQFPAKKRQKPTEPVTRIAFLIEENKKLLVVRKQKGWMKGLWMFPGIFKKGVWNPKDLLKTEFPKISAMLSDVEALPSHTHSVTHHRIAVYPYVIRVKKKEQILVFADFYLEEETLWLNGLESKKMGLPSADRKIFELWKQTKEKPN